MRFPKVLDNASVLFYTPRASYGTVRYITGEIAEYICYLAICKYESDASFYLFGCNAEYEVVSDSVWGSAEECMRAASSFCDSVISWIEAE